MMSHFSSLSAGCPSVCPNSAPRSEKRSMLIGFHPEPTPRSIVGRYRYPSNVVPGLLGPIDPHPRHQSWEVVVPRQPLLKLVADIVERLPDAALDPAILSEQS